MKIIELIKIIIEKVTTSIVAIIIKDLLFSLFNKSKNEKAPETINQTPMPIPKPSIKHTSSTREFKIGRLTISMATSYYTFRID